MLQVSYPVQIELFYLPVIPIFAAMSEAWTVRRLLEWTSAFFGRKDVDSPRLSAELLLSHVLGVPRIKLYTDYERVLNESQLARFRELVQRAGESEPIAYLTGRAHFFNLEFAVNRDVLIPRPETETLVEHVLQLARHETGMSSPRILELCTGSGCIAAAIGRHLKTATILATDISDQALVVAGKNLEDLQLSDRIALGRGDLFDALTGLPDAHQFDLIIANPPYIRTDQMAQLDKNVRDYEPHIALDGGIDGLQVHRRILAGAVGHLPAGGRIFLEIAFDQGESATAMAGEFPEYTEVKILKDHAAHDRILAVRRRDSL